MADLRVQQSAPVHMAPVSADGRSGSGHRDQSPPRERSPRQGAEELAIALRRTVRPWEKRMVLPRERWEFKLAHLVRTAPKGTTFIVDTAEKRERGLQMAAEAERIDLGFLVEEGTGT